MKLRTFLPSSSCRSCVVFLGALGRGAISLIGLCTSEDMGAKSNRLLSSKSTTTTASSNSMPSIAEDLKLRVTTSHILTRTFPLGALSSSCPSGSFQISPVKVKVPHGVADKLSTVTVPRNMVCRAITSVKMSPMPRLAIAANIKRTTNAILTKAKKPISPFLYSCIYLLQ
ncbi:hypothetical protein HSIVP1_912 [Veillonella parvula HSIVP1]|nr:hypothetical protein HSIVP1_912 [Veillonella parvula HSIVP1]